MGTISDKTTYLNTTKTKIREKINDLGQDLDEEDTFRSYAEALEQVWNEYPKVTATDVEEATLNGTKKGRMNIDAEGNTYQEQLTGKNLANASSEYTITGSQRYRDIPCVAEAGNYICSIESWETDGSETLSAVMLINANGSTVKNFQFSNTTKSVACNMSSDVAKIRIYSQSGYQPSGGVTTTVKNLMFRKSTEDATYEPYCGGIPAPNPRLRMPY